MIERKHYLAALITGLLLGLLINYILYAIAIPAYSDYLLPLSSYQALNNFWDIFYSASLYEEQFFALLVVCTLPFMLTIISNINPLLQIDFSTRKLPEFSHSEVSRKGRAWLSILISIIVMDIILFVIGEDGAKAEQEMWGAVLLGGAFVWIILSASALGNFTSEISKRSIKNYFITALHGAAFTGLFLLLVIGLFYIFTEYAFPIITEVYDPNFEMSMFGFKSISIFLMLSTIITVMLMTSILPLFTKIDTSVLNRINMAKKGVSAMLIMSLVLVISLPIMSKQYELDKKPLTDSDFLKNITAEKYSLVRLCSDDVCANTYPINETKRNSHIDIESIKQYVNVYRPVGDSNVPVNRFAIEPLRQFAIQTSSLSVKRKLAVEGLIAIHEKLLQPAAYVAEIQSLEEADVIPAATSTLWTLNQVRWLATAAPITKTNYQRLEFYSNKKLFFHGRVASVYLASAWARFGNNKQSEYFKNNVKQDDLIKYTPDKDGEIVAPTLTDGSISGRVTSTTLSLDNLRVVLVVANTVKGKTIIKKPKAMLNVVANVSLQKDGKFEFKNLTNGDFGLALITNENVVSDKSQISVSGVTGLIRVSKNKPEVMLKAISINKNNGK